LNISETTQDKSHIYYTMSVGNGTMFDDLDWPLNASCRFVSISWVSCS